MPFKLSGGMNVRDHSSVFSWFFGLSVARPSTRPVRRKKNVIRILLTALFYNDLWEPYYSTGEHLSVDETIISGYIMRRRSGGGMIYRAMTEDEIRDAAWDQANQI